MFDKVAENLEISTEEFLHTRKQPYVWYKQVVISIVRDETNKGWTELGRELNLNHATIYHNYNRGIDIRSNKFDKTYKRIVKKLSEILNMDCSI